MTPIFRAQIVFFAGLTVAITGAAKMPADGQQWSDAWWIFAVGAVIATVGLVAWRLVRSAALRAAATVTLAADADPFALLDSLVPAATDLGQRMAGADIDTVTRDVDGLLDRYVLPFAEVRERVIERLGMQTGAEILVTVAYGERLLNRVWSAAADGHLVEARACFPQALGAFVDARDSAQKARESL